MIDQAREIRDGEGVELERLEPLLRAHVDGLGAGPLEVRQFPAGHSNLTYLIVGEERELVLRRPPFGAQVKTGHDMGREVRMLSALHGVWPYVPEPLWSCEDESVLGAPFYVMERVKGVILRRSPPEGVVLDEAVMSGVCESLVQTLVGLHAVDIDATGLRALGKPEGYVARQVQGWTRRLDKAKTEPLPDLDVVAEWLAANLPPEADASLIHNDFKYDNLVLDPDDLTRVRAVLDWEMATVGDPLMDLGTTLAYWIDPDDAPELHALAFGPTTRPGNLTRAELVARYAELSGRDVSDAVFYYVYGLFKVAGIGQQIFYRYHHGFTKDPRFAMLIYAVKALGATARAAIEQGSLAPRLS